MVSNMKKIITIFIIYIFTLQFSFAQYGSYGVTDAQTVALGNTFGSSFSTLAIGKNPAFLSYAPDTNNYIAFQFPNLSAKAVESTMSIEDYNKYFNYTEAKELSDEEKIDFYNSFDDNNGIYFNLGSKIFALAVKPSDDLGTFGLSVTDYVAGTGKIPLTLIDLIINGNTPKTTYKFDDFSFNMWWIRAHTLSWAKEIMKFDDEGFIKNLSVGASAKYISGLSYAGVENFSAELTTGENHQLSGSVNYLANSAIPDDLSGYFVDPSGSGFGFDIGFAADLAHSIKVGLAVTDIGSITWDNQAEEYIANGDIYIDDLFDKNQRNDLKNFLNSSSYPVGSFSTSLPTALRLSMAYNISEDIESVPGDMTLQIGYNQGFNEMPGNSLTPRIGLGVRWKTFSFLPILSTGISNNRAGGLAWSLGLGYSTNVLDFCIASQDILSFINSGSSPHLSFAMNFIWKITL